MLTSLSLHLLPVFVAHLIVIASPEPSTMAIVAVAMSQGRRSAMMLALGVVTGSMIWAVLTASGISAVLTAYAHAIFVLKIIGGLYLLYLAWKAARSALAKTVVCTAPVGQMRSSALYRRGVLVHLSNPKAALGWIAIMSFALRPGAPPHTVITLIAGCAVLGLMVNISYALLFSSSPVGRAYQRSRQWIEGTLAAVFAGVGFRLLLSKV